MNDAAKEIVTGQTESAGFTLVERLLQSHAVYVRRGVGGSRHSLDAALEGEGIKNINKAVYTATPVVGRWAGVVMSWAGALMISVGALASMKYSIFFLISELFYLQTAQKRKKSKE